MNDLRIEDATQQDPYAGLTEEAFASSPPLSSQIDELRNIVLWLSKQQWKQDDDQTWDGLVAAYEKATELEPPPEPHTVKVMRIGR